MNEAEFEQHVKNSYFLNQLFAELQTGYAEGLMVVIDALAAATNPQSAQRALAQAIAAPPLTGRQPLFVERLLQDSLKRIEQRIQASHHH